tara:strand:- start:265 stop:438 length:174 start_codon:yes stop_codon:yes gene_type:complete
MRKKLTIFFLCLSLVSCGSTKQISDKKENYETEQRIMKGLLFSLVTYAIFSIIKKPI